MKSLTELLNSASQVKLPSVSSTSSGRGLMSFGLINSEKNGKRFTMTKSLISAIGVDKTVELLPIPDENVLMLAKKLPFENAIKKNLKNNGDGRLSYAAPVVTMLVQCFNLEFGNHVSMTFQDITIDELPDKTPVAIINMQNPKPYSVSTSQEDEMSDEETGS